MYSSCTKHPHKNVIILDLTAAFTGSCAKYLSKCCKFLPLHASARTHTHNQHKHFIIYHTQWKETILIFLCVCVSEWTNKRKIIRNFHIIGNNLWVNKRIRKIHVYFIVSAWQNVHFQRLILFANRMSVCNAIK